MKHRKHNTETETHFLLAAALPALRKRNTGFDILLLERSPWMGVEF
jgi:hypothetical protein